MVHKKKVERPKFGGSEPNFALLNHNVEGISEYCLVGGIPTPLKNMSSSVGMMTFPTEWKVIKFMFQTTNQLFNVQSHSLCVPQEKFSAPAW